MCTLHETHLDQLSSLYSNDTYTVVVYETPLQQRLSAVVYVNEERPSDIDIVTHLNSVYQNLQLESYEAISIIRIVKDQKPPLNEFGEVDYRAIRSVAVHY